MKYFFLLLTLFLYSVESFSQNSEVTDLINSGASKIELKKYREAIDDYSKVIELTPEYAIAYYLRGWAKYLFEDYKGCIADISRMVELDPGSPFIAKIFLIRGMAKWNAKDTTGALSDYDKSIKITPTNSESYYLRGKIKSDIGDFASAINDYTKTIELNPEFGYGYLDRAASYGEIGDYENSVIDYTQAISFFPNDVESLSTIYHWRGVAYIYIGHYQEGIIDLDNYIGLTPKDKEVSHGYHNRGIAKMSISDYEGAIEDFNTSILIKPNDPCTNTELNLVNVLEKYNLNPSIKIYPTIITDKAIIEVNKTILKKQGYLQFVVFDILGKEVQKNEIISQYTELIRDYRLKSGVYFYKIFSEGNLLDQNKIILQ